MRPYLDILRKALETGVDREDRTGTGTRAIFGEVMRFRMSDGFPAVTTKRLAFRSVLGELLWFLAGSSDVNELHALGVRIWDGNAFAPYWIAKARFPGDAGRNYGQQWRDWIGPNGSHVDQLANVITQLKESPESRRHVVTAWNPGELDDTSLPACHALFQFFVAPGEGHFGQGNGRQRFDRRRARDELAGTGEELARRLDLFGRIPSFLLISHQPFSSRTPERPRSIPAATCPRARNRRLVIVASLAPRSLAASR